MKNLKINQKLNRRAIIVVGVLFLANLFAVSTSSAANYTDIERPDRISKEEFELKIENWMLNSNLFFEMVQSEKNFTIEEQELYLEPWMLDSTVFSKYLNTEEKPKNNFYPQEEELELEPWMVELREFSNF